MYYNKVCAVIYLTVYLYFGVHGYEKTLRKIIRNQSKMVQRPLSENIDLNLAWKNSSLAKNSEATIFPGYAQMKRVFHKMPKSKISTIFASVDSGRSKSGYSRNKIRNEEYVHPNDLRLARNTITNSSINLQSSMNSVFFPETINDNRSDAITVDNYYQIPETSKFFSRTDQHDVQNIEQNMIKADGLVSLERRSSKENGTFITHTTVIPEDANLHKAVLDMDNDRDKNDYILEGVSLETGSFYNYTNPIPNSYTCTVVKEIKADINTEEKFAEFNIEPAWTRKKSFWNNIYDNRYVTLMKNPQWPPLQVILVPRTHVDTIWRRSFDQYHKELVGKIISNVVKKLNFYHNSTFTWNEVSHLSQWWNKASQKRRSLFRKLLKSGRLEITTGGWVEPDEATTTLFELVHQLIEGHQWLKTHLNYIPKIGWLTNTVSHSPTMTYLLSIADITQLVITNLHYSWEEYLAEYQYSDFIWLQNWDSNKSKSLLNEALKKIGNDRYPEHSVLTHFLQFNSAGFKACGPKKSICTAKFNFAKLNKNLDINSYNVKEKSELLLEQYSKTGTISSHNVIIAPIGGPYCYEVQTEFDYQYNNYQKIADFVNLNSEIYRATIQFGTPKDYFTSILEKHKTYPTLKGDFVNFADISSGEPAYWTGFYTSRPLSKILLRKLQSNLRSADILLTFAVTMNTARSYNMSKIFDLLIKARENVARLSDRNVVSGTLTSKALRYVHSLIFSIVKDCWYIQEVAASLLSVKSEQNVPYVQKYVYRDGELISPFKTVSTGDQIYLFNSLNHEKTEVVELITRYPNIRILNHEKKDVAIQINPIWKYSSDNLIKISRNFFKVIFVTVIPPLTFQLYMIKETYDATLNAATIYCLSCVSEDAVGNKISPFTIQPLQAGDIQLENYKLRLIFDEDSGFLKSVFEKETNIQKIVLMDYGAFRDSDKNSGMFLFNTNVSHPLYDILKLYRVGTKSKIVMIISGSVSTELTSVYGRLLQNTVRILNLMQSPLSNAIFVETKVDYEISPINRELELFLSIQTDISNGNPAIIYTDNNGFQFSARVLNITRRIESNVYPITSMVYIQDRKNRFTLITDHAQGVTTLQEGQIVVFLDRRVLYDDGRGTNEGLADSSSTYQRHVILLENFLDTPVLKDFSSQPELKLPSLVATNIASAMNYLIDVFIIDKNLSHLCNYPILPLIKTPFPCDVSLLNYRLILNSSALSLYTPSSALMTLHRHGIYCQINYSTYYHQCNDDASFSLDKILSNVKAVYRTNLVGTRKIAPLFTYTKEKFPPMELMTLQILF